MAPQSLLGIWFFNFLNSSASKAFVGLGHREVCLLVSGWVGTAPSTEIVLPMVWLGVWFWWAIASRFVSSFIGRTSDLLMVPWSLSPARQAAPFAHSYWRGWAGEAGEIVSQHLKPGLEPCRLTGRRSRRTKLAWHKQRWVRGWEDEVQGRGYCPCQAKL